jgi:hypothetical protein
LSSSSGVCRREGGFRVARRKDARKLEFVLIRESEHTLADLRSESRDEELA